MSHTPGPWTQVIHEAVDGGDYIQVLTGSWDIAHNRHSARDWEEEKANARLIAAAPDLLAACKNVERYLDVVLPAGPTPFTIRLLDKNVRQLRQAIGKASAEEPTP